MLSAKQRRHISRARSTWAGLSLSTITTTAVSAAAAWNGRPAATHVRASSYVWSGPTHHLYLDPQWQLSHDRIIAVRATPPHLANPGDVSVIDALLGRKNASPIEQSPDGVQVISPPSLAGTLANANGVWTVTAPADLSAARAELHLAADAPVPLQLGVGFTATKLAATKVVVLGDAGENPTLDNLVIDGAAPVDPISVAALTDIPMSLTADDTTEDVNWLSSCGTMHDFDLAKSYLRVEAPDPQSGQIGVVLRNGKGGVAWQFWSIAARAPATP